MFKREREREREGREREREREQERERDCDISSFHDIVLVEGSLTPCFKERERERQRERARERETVIFPLFMTLCRWKPYTPSTLLLIYIIARHCDFDESIYSRKDTEEKCSKVTTNMENIRSYFVMIIQIHYICI